MIRPGDRVLLTMTRTISDDAAYRIKERLGHDFPGVQFTLVGQCSGALVMQQHEAPDEVDLDLIRAKGRL